MSTSAAPSPDRRKHHHAIRQLHRLLDVVRHKEDRLLSAASPQQLAPHRNRVIESSAPNGSSRYNTSGSTATPAHFQTRFIPPESSRGYDSRTRATHPLDVVRVRAFLSASPAGQTEPDVLSTVSHGTHPAPETRKSARIRLRHPIPIDRHGPFRRLQKPADDIRAATFHTRRPVQKNELPLRNGKVDVIGAHDGARTAAKRHADVLEWTFKSRGG